MSEVSIIPSTISVQMTSTLQNVNISINNASVVVSLASGEYLPTDPTFNSLTVTNDADVGRDLTVGRFIDAVDDITTESNIYADGAYITNDLSCDDLMVNSDALLTTVNISGDVTNVNTIKLNSNPVNIPTAIGTLYYDSDDNCAAIVLPNGVRNQISSEVFFDVLNISGSTMLNGKLVYIDGEQGNRVTVSYATNATCASASRCIAMLTQDIANNTRGKATFLGLVRSLNTQGLTGGPELWLGTNGDWTTTKPAIGTARVRIGRVAKEHPTDGHALVVIQQDKYMFGDRDNGNYSVFEDSGFLAHYGTSKPHEDLNFDVINSGGPAANIPDYVLINNIAYREFTSANNQRCSGSKEFPHEGYIATAQDLIAHTHGFLKAGESAGTTGVTFTAYWEIRQSTGITNGSVQLSATSAQLQANAHKVDLYASVSFSGPIELGAQVSMTLARTGGNAGDFIPITYGFHYAKDGGGSRTATSK